MTDSLTGSLCLLQSGNFFRYTSPQYLWLGAGVITIFLAVIVLLIYFRLYIRKRRYLYQTEIRHRLEEWISESIDRDSAASLPDLSEFARSVRHPTGRQYITEELIACRKNFTGPTAANIVDIYLQLGLKKYSLQKLGSLEWHVKAKGIQELYIMDQRDTLTRIYHHTNHRNEYVRMEAQIGILHLAGFEGLRFLDVISYPLTEWQQIKLLEQLRHSRLTDKLSEAIPHWFCSANDSVVQFALKLTAEYQHLDLHDQVVPCLSHPNDHVRKQAIITITWIANEETPGLLIQQFPQETYYNKIAILDSLDRIGTPQDIPFLRTTLLDKDDMIRLKAARALSGMVPQGLQVLEEQSLREPEPYALICAHVKSERKL